MDGPPTLYAGHIDSPMLTSRRSSLHGWAENRMPYRWATGAVPRYATQATGRLIQHLDLPEWNAQTCANSRLSLRREAIG